MRKPPPREPGQKDRHAERLAAMSMAAAERIKAETSETMYETTVRTEMVAFRIDVSQAVYDRIEAMRLTGLWGDTIEDVCVTLIRQGIVRLIAEGVLPKPEGL